jgi:hypothetical protein
MLPEVAGPIILEVVNENGLPPRGPLSLRVDLLVD